MKIFLLLILLTPFAEVPALADTGTLYEIASPSCSCAKLEGKAWQRVPPFPVGTMINGKPHPSQSTSIIFVWQNAWHTCPAACLQKPNVNPVQPPAVSNARSPASNTSTATVSPASPTPFFLTASILSWQESINVVGSDQTSYPLLSSSLGVSLGLEFRKQVSHYFEFELGANFVYGETEIAEKTAETQVSSIRYRASGVKVAAIKLTPGIFWVIQPEAAFGLSIPLMYRRGFFPEPGSGYSLSYSNFLPGAALASRFTGKSFTIQPQIGFLGQLKSFYWTIELGYRL